MRNRVEGFRGYEQFILLTKFETTKPCLMKGIGKFYDLVGVLAPFAVRLDAHSKPYHSGTLPILAFIRAKYWIVQARQLIKPILQRCMACLRFHEKNAIEPWTVLPGERLATSILLETAGVDFAGPLCSTSRY
ncbi:hypothetical protein GQX74_010181 [Glossina fuscipes]|nr:hypothetical protein GQX74_010181 [Glossina fuscipes]